MSSISKAGIFIDIKQLCVAELVTLMTGAIEAIQAELTPAEE